MAYAEPIHTAALRMRNGNPEAFEDFQKELEKYFNTLLLDTMKADNSQVLQAQGRAHTAYAILTILKECNIRLERPKPEPPQ